MSKVKKTLVIIILLLCIGCKGKCPKGYSFYNNRCYKYESIDAEVRYYCNSGGTLNGTKCLVKEEYNCSRISDEEICTRDYEYFANKEYICPDGYTLNGKLCSKIKYYKN